MAERTRQWITGATVGLIVAAAAGVVASGAALAAPAADAGDPPRVVIIGDDDKQVVLTIDGARLHVVGIEGDEVETATIDLEEIGQIIDEAVSSAMRGVSAALQGLVCQPDHSRRWAQSDRADAERAQLQAEIAELRAEIARLREDLQRRR